MSARPDDLGAGFDLGLAEEREPSVASPGEACGNRVEWTLPGLGMPCGRSAHRAFRWRGCPRGHAVPYVDSWDGRSCPTCWRGGLLSREAGHLAARLFAESAARRSRNRRWGIVHVSINPPRDLWAMADPAGGRSFGKLRSKAYRIARMAGVEGGCVVFHRVRCADRDDPVETDGPHFHILGFGWKANGAVTFNRTGWIVRNQGLRANRASVRGTASYVLSHSHRAEGNLPEGKSKGVTLTVTWFGRTVSAPEIPEDGHYCPLCEECYPKREWLELEWVGQGPPPTEPVVVKKSDWQADVLERATWPAVRIEVQP